MRLRHVLSCQVVTRDVYVQTPEVDAAGEAEFSKLMDIAQVFMDGRNPSKSTGKVEVHNAVECDEQYDGQTFKVEINIGDKVETKLYRRGDDELEVYDSVSKYTGDNCNHPMSVHCSKWYHSDIDRPNEYDDLLSKKRADRPKGVYRKCLPIKENLFKEGSIYYESGFLWKAWNGAYVWVRHLP